MRFWQEALILLAVLWASQAAGTWMQMRHYRDVMRRITQSWPDGCVGASASRGTFGRGVLCIVVASPDATVRQVFLMEGRSVFAKFREIPALAGHSLATLPTDAFATAHKGRQKALTGAIAQITATLARGAAAASHAQPATGSTAPTAGATPLAA
jgi:glucitol operon activator protein